MKGEGDGAIEWVSLVRRLVEALTGSASPRMMGRLASYEEEKIRNTSYQPPCHAQRHCC